MTLADFCGGVPFVNETLLNIDAPILTSCFLDTALSWIPCGILWFFAPFHMMLLLKFKRLPTQTSYTHILKAALSIGTACLVELELTMLQKDGINCEGRMTIPMSTYTAVGIKFATFLLVTVILQVERKCGHRSSGLLFAFWLLILTAESFKLYTFLVTKVSCSETLVFYIYYGLLCVQLIMSCFAEKAFIGKSPEEFQKACPADSASPLNLVLFQWVNSLVIQCYRKTFSPNNAWQQAEDLQTRVVGPVLEKQWMHDVKITRETLTRKQSEHTNASYSQFRKNTEETQFLLSSDHSIIPKTSSISADKEPGLYCTSLTRTLLKTFWWDYGKAVLWNTFSALNYLMMPQFLQLVIDLIEKKESGTEPVWKGYTYAAGIFVMLQLCSLTFNVSVDLTARLGVKVKSALMYLIYRKGLTLSRLSAGSSVGETVTLMSVDCQRIQDFCFYSYYWAVTCVTIPVTIVFLWLLVGKAALAGVIIMFLIAPFKVWMAVTQHRLQNELLQFKSKRVRLMNEVVSGIKVLKMYAWEPAFMAKIGRIRDQEIKRLRKNAYLIAISTAIANCSHLWMHLGIMLTYLFITDTNYLSNNVVFVSFAMVSLLKWPLSMLPTLINGLVQAVASVSRIHGYLASPDVPTNTCNKASSQGTSCVAVHIKDGHFTWEEGENTIVTLNNINLTIRKGELVGVLGYCGAGKSSLISSILGEMKQKAGTLTVNGSIAYVPQEAWIQNMTLKNNILFGRSRHPDRYSKVIKACCLKPDIDLLEAGDQTEIGEKGANISGGQKQRISLARAVYADADIYVLDDPLSAVDSHVGKDLFKNVISNDGILKKKTRILVTHAIHWLPFLDRIVVMDQCRISEMGTYEELMSHNGPFAQFLHMHLRMDKPETSDPELEKIYEDMLEQSEMATSDGGISSDDIFNHPRRQKTRQHRKRPRTRTRLYTSSLGMSESVTPAPITQVERIGTLTSEETLQEGSIKMSVVLDYFKVMGRWMASMSIFIFTIYQIINTFSMYWLTFWTEDTYLKNESLSNTAESSNRFTMYMSVYLVMTLVQVVLIFLTFYVSLTRMAQASQTLHKEMLNSVLRAPMWFFDTTPIGRILNRFSSDMDTVDIRLPESFRLWVIIIFSTVASILVLCITTPLVIVVTAVGVFLCTIVMGIYLPTARKMRRVEAVKRSPLYSHFGETVSGAPVIRAFQCADRFIQEAIVHIDTNMKYHYFAFAGSRWVGVRLEFLGNVLTLAFVLFALLADDVNGGEIGMGISYAVQLCFSINSIVFAIADLEMNLVAVERVGEYQALESEADWGSSSTSLPVGWPTNGKVEYREYSARYRPGLDLVLKGITCTVRPFERVAIVGRTGAGKSSLTLSLFRLIEAADGGIFIDGVQISELGLHELRARLSILPQEPVLFSGTLRMNVDPLDEFNDDRIWSVLGNAHLKSFAMSQSNRLDYDCGEAGSNLRYYSHIA